MADLNALGIDDSAGFALNTVVESGEEALDEWATAVRNGTGRDYINSIDVKAMEEGTLIDLLSSMLLTLYDMEDSDEALLDQLLDAFEVLRPAFTREVAFSTILVGLPLINLTAVSYVWLRRAVSIETVILDCNEWVSPSDIDITMTYVVRIYLREDQEQPYDPRYNPAREGDLSDLLSATSIGALMDAATDRGNDALWNWLRPYFSVNAPIVPPGPWMREGGPPYVPKLPRAWVEVPPGVISDELMTQLRERVPEATLVRAERMLIGDAHLCSSRQRREVYQIQDNRYTEEEEELLFRTYGPSNPFFIEGPLTPSMIQEADEQYPPGSDRMFLCDLYNLEEDEDGIDVDQPTAIFTGVCDYAGHKIGTERCAVRRPARGGGWYNSYCSFRDMEEQIEGNRIEDDSIDEDAAMVQTMKQEVMRLGIYFDDPTRSQCAVESRCTNGCSHTH